MKITALLYDDYIALRDGKMTEERAKELGIKGYKKGNSTSPIGSLHNWECNSRRPEESTWGSNETADNR